MGWYYGFPTVQKLINELVEPFETAGGKAYRRVLRYQRQRTREADILWTIEEQRSLHDDEAVRFIGCYLLDKNPTSGWGYKPMDETMGPVYYSLPWPIDEVEKIVGPPQNSFAEAWRHDVRQAQGVTP